MLRHFRALTQDRGVSLESAANAVIERFGSGAIRNVSPSGMTPKTRDVERCEQLIEKVDLLLKQNEKQEKFNQKLIERLDQQQNYIEESFKKRDAELMQTLREIQETKLLLTAAEEKRSWWKKLMGK